ncbi:hypothetical protein MYX07_03525 [Patescibacteria group bacterium AH-259-L07]|nr:hypothetical protein [Patescibacteria group bacterium AH-259-L07]
MGNIALFVITVPIYLGIWYWISWLRDRPLRSKHVQRIALLALLCLPFNFNGTVFTVIGNITGKNTYSVASLYQNAGNVAFTFFGLSGYQNAGRDAWIAAGLSGYQNAGRDAWTLVGLSGYQNAGNDAATLIGIGFYQKVADKERTFGVWYSLKRDSD